MAHLKFTQDQLNILRNEFFGNIRARGKSFVSNVAVLWRLTVHESVTKELDDVKPQD